MEINEITGIVVDEAYKLHAELGPGLFESVYELVLADALAARGLKVARQVAIPIQARGKIYAEGFCADLIVEDIVIVEIKSVEQLSRVHKKQVLTYLKLTSRPVGLLINFGGELLKDNLKRLVITGAQDLKS